MAHAPDGLSDKERLELREAFGIFDKNADGTISIEELNQVLDTVGGRKYSRDQIALIMGKFDSDGDGSIDFDEFSRMMSSSFGGSSRGNGEFKDQAAEEVDELHEAFKIFDRDGNGSISAAEIHCIMKALGESIDEKTIELMVKSVDTDGNGSVDFEEFKKMMMDGPPV